MALRGHATIQGSTDIPTLYDLLPGYLPMPGRARTSTTPRRLRRRPSGADAAGGRTSPSTSSACSRRGTATRRRRRTTSASSGCRRSPATTRTSRRCCARCDGGARRAVRAWARTRPSAGQNARPAAAGAGEAEWLVVRDSSRPRRRRFWNDCAGGPVAASCARRTSRPRSSSCRPPSHVEKDGSLHQHAAAGPVARQGGRPARRRRSELWFMYHLGKRLKALYARLATPTATGRSVNLTWDYPEHGRASASRTPRRCCRRSTATTVADGRAGARLRRAEGRRLDRLRLLDLLRRLRRRRQPGAAARRRRPRRAGRLGLARVGLRLAGQPPHPLQPRLGRPEGSRGRERKKLRLVGRGRRASGPGYDVPDFPPTSRRTTSPTTDAGAWTRSPATDPFIMKADGKGWLFVADRPARRPAADPLRAGRVAGRRTCSTRAERNPAALTLGPRRTTRCTDAATRATRYVVTTYRLTEHHTAGAMSRWLPWLAELQPEMFVEIDPSWPPSAASRTATGW